LLIQKAMRHDEEMVLQRLLTLYNKNRHFVDKKRGRILPAINEKTVHLLFN